MIYPKIEDTELRKRLGELLHNNSYYGEARSWKTPVVKSEIKEIVEKTYPHDVKNKEQADTKAAFIDNVSNQLQKLAVADEVKEEWMVMADRFVFDLCKRFGLKIDLQ